jgi:hypothetical protein
MENNVHKNGAKIAFQQDGNIQIQSDRRWSTDLSYGNMWHTLSTQPVMSTGLLSHLTHITQSLHAGLLKLWSQPTGCSNTACHRDGHFFNSHTQLLWTRVLLCANLRLFQDDGVAAPVKRIFDNCAQSQNEKHDTVCHLAHHRQNQGIDFYSWSKLTDNAYSNEPCKKALRM